MELEQLKSTLNSLRSRLFGYAVAMVPDRKLALEVMGQALTVFLFKEKSFLNRLDGDELQADRKYLNKYLLLSLSQELHKIAKNRFSQKNFSVSEFQSFYELPLLERSALYLAEKKVPFEEIGEIMGLEKHEVIQYVYRARGNLAQVFDVKNLEVMYAIEKGL